MSEESNSVAVQSADEQTPVNAPVQPELENGFVKVPAGDWLVSASQPVACKGASSVTGLKGWIVPDRGELRRLSASDSCWCAEQTRPFLTRLDALPDEKLCLVSSKLLISHYGTRTGSSLLRVIPMNFRGSICYTEFQGGWLMAATRSRVTRISLSDCETLTVRPESLVGWCGKKPTGFCPRLSVLDMFLPRRPSNLCFSFYGPAVVWIEGSSLPVKTKGVRVCG